MVDNRQLWKALHSLFDILIRNEIVFFHVICYIVQLSVLVFVLWAFMGMFVIIVIHIQVLSLLCRYDYADM